MCCFRRGFLLSSDSHDPGLWTPPQPHPQGGTCCIQLADQVGRERRGFWSFNALALEVALIMATHSPVAYHRVAWKQFHQASALTAIEAQSQVRRCHRLVTEQDKR